MSSEFNPWSRTEAEEWANSYMAERQITPEDEGSKLLFDSFLAGLAKAAEVIEKCETVYKNEKFDGWYPYRDNYMALRPDTHQAKLVGIRPIEKGKTE